MRTWTSTSASTSASMEGFERLGVAFAFPTTTVQMEPPLKL